MIFSVCVWGCSEAEDPTWDAPLVVVHTQSSIPPTDAEFPYVWYYRTEVRNVSQKPMKIVWFDCYSFYDEQWYADTIMGHVLRGSDFSRWYTEGDQISDGIIPPGAVAVCDANWYGSDTDELVPSKWAYIAVDQSGNDYFFEGVVDQDVMTHLVNTQTAGQGVDTDEPTLVE